MRANIEGECSADCECNQKINDQGPYSLKTLSWTSNCPNRSKRLECKPHDTCDNTRLTTKKNLHVGSDLDIKMCWGIDVYTRYNIYSILGVKDSIDEKNAFIDTLLKVSNFTSFEGWNLRRSCQLLREMILDPDKREKLGLLPEFWLYSKMVEDLLLYKQGREGFRLYSKGLGVVCVRDSGIKVNELVVEYLGEVYSASQWFEKQDAIKMFLIEIKYPLLNEGKANSVDQKTRQTSQNIRWKMEFQNFII
jgi:hypothetical protein